MSTMEQRLHRMAVNGTPQKDSPFPMSRSIKPCSSTIMMVAANEVRASFSTGPEQANSTELKGVVFGLWEFAANEGILPIKK